MKGVRAQVADVTKTIEDWRLDYRGQLDRRRGEPDVAILARFASALLERQMSGEAYDRRTTIFLRKFQTYAELTEERVAAALAEAGYRFPNQGRQVVMEVKKLVTKQVFSWRGYFKEAEANYESNFRNDDFLRIKNIGFKTRDFALSEFSDRFVAIDMQVGKVILRTGLILHAYGDPRIDADYRSDRGYLSMHDLVLKLSKQTGWPGAGYSPGEMDRMFWLFGRSTCTVEPRCTKCPLGEVCLTGARLEPGETTPVTGGALAELGRTQRSGHRLTINAAVFLAAKLLSKEKTTFTVEELRDKIEEMFGDTRPGVTTHIYAHCVANAPKNTLVAYNYLWRVDRGRYRLFDPRSDHPHPSRKGGRTTPDRAGVPSEYRDLLT
jgi:hypothetical protein